MLQSRRTTGKDPNSLRYLKDRYLARLPENRDPVVIAIPKLITTIATPDHVVHVQSKPLGCQRRRTTG
jgi:hypothetical protein